jgi:thiamine-phosphate pyrophosphorylase
MWPPPVICLVTDRHRLAQRLALDPDGEPILTLLVEIVGAAAEAGIDLVQVREADLDAQRLIAVVHRLVRQTRGTKTRVVVNDRLDVALAAEAHGVHLKDRPVSAARIRAAAPDAFLIGQSIHSPGRAAGSDADYLVFGTVFQTSSKPELRAVAGLAGLAAAAKNAGVPVLGIGGVTVSRFGAMAAAGADGFAAVDLFLPSESGRPAPFHEIIAEARETFDTAGRSS